MANRLTMIDEARLRIRRLKTELGSEVREGRIARGLRQVDVARALGWSRSKVGRIERGEEPNASLEDIAAMAAAVGLRLSVQLYPAGGHLRDGRQAAMINAYCRMIDRGGWAVATEVPVGDSRDQRAIDLVLSRPGAKVAHEFLSRVRDAQAQTRPLLLKARQAGANRLILVIAGTHANRRAVAEAGAALRSSFPLGTREVLHALRAGREPGGNGIVFL